MGAQAVSVLKLDHPTDPRFLIYPVAPETLRNEDVFSGLYGRLLTVVGQPETDVYTFVATADLWTRQAGEP